MASQLDSPGLQRRFFKTRRRASTLATRHELILATNVLIDFVPPEDRREPVPCHHIPLTAVGETVDAIEWTGNQEELEAKVKSWLRATISRIETAREIS